MVKNETKSAYLRGRLENIQAIAKRDEESSQRKSIDRTLRALSIQEIQHIHSSKLLADRVKKISLPNLQEKKMRETAKQTRVVYANTLSQQQNEDALSSYSIFSDLATSSYRSRKSLPRTQSKTKAESTGTSSDKTPKQTAQGKTTFDDYFSATTINFGHVEPENLEFAKYNTSRITKFVHKLKNIKLKESQPSPVGIHIKSNSLVQASPRSLKLKTKNTIPVILHRKSSDQSET